MALKPRSGPIFKIISGPTPTRTGVDAIVTSGLAPLVSAGSIAADIYIHTDAGLEQMLRFRAHATHRANQRTRWLGGRIYNRLSGEDPNYIPISGTHMRQTLLEIGIEPPDFVIARGKYMLRIDFVDEAITSLTEKRISSGLNTVLEKNRT